jgi:hypothetical protein
MMRARSSRSGHSSHSSHSGRSSEAAGAASAGSERRHRERGSRRDAARSRRDAAEAAAGPEDPLLTRLIVLGWIVGLLYFPSGLLHGVAGAVVYVRDLLMGFHLLASLFWLSRQGHLKWVAQHSWVFLITPVLLIPGVMDHNYTLEALRTCKWSICWLDWIVLGYLLRMNQHWGQWFKLLGAVTLLMMCTELVAGAIEWQTGSYLFPTSWNEKTALGVSRGNDQLLEGKMRIHGLQRDVFSFANVMGMNAVAGMACLALFRNSAVQLGGALWACAFGFMMVVSGGRSALFGAFAAAVYTGWLLLAPVSAGKNGRRYVLAWVLIAIALSLVGVGKFTDFVGEQFLGGAHIGDSDSAYMRDNYWVKMRAAFVGQPLILVLGGPFVSLLDSKTDVMFHWADNQLLWNLYHTGIIGSVAVIFFFYKVLENEPRESERLTRQALILFLLFVVGEGIARESLTFIGCLPLFVLCGYDSAGQVINQRAPAPVSARRVRLARRSEGGQR